MTPFELERVHATLQDQLRAQDASLDGILYCPHVMDDGLAPYRRRCECRKPRPGLLHLASVRHDVDLAQAWVIGDALRDLEAAAAAGARSILVHSGKGEREAERLGELSAAAQPFAVVPGVLQAVELALDAPARSSVQGR